MEGIKEHLDQARFGPILTEDQVNDLPALGFSEDAETTVFPWVSIIVAGLGNFHIVHAEAVPLAEGLGEIYPRTSHHSSLLRVLPADCTDVADKD